MPVTDVWGRSVDIGDVVPTDRVTLTLKSGDQTISTGILARRVELQHDRDIAPLLDLSSGKIAQLAMPPRPVVLGLQGFVMKADDYKSLIESLANVCSESAPSSLTVEVTPAQCPGSTTPKVSYVLINPRLRAVQSVVETQETGALFVAAIQIIGVALQIS